MINYVLIIVIMLVGIAFLNKKFKNLIKKNECFTASVVHDLKSPLQAQINILNAFLHKEYGQLNKEQNEMLKLLYESCQYMTNLITNVLDSYKCKNYTIIPDCSEFNLADLTNSVCADNEQQASDNGQKILRNFSGENFNIYGDKLQIKRVIFNLLSNALTYGLKNSVISVELGQKNNGIHFSISNKCHLINKGDVKNLFRQFSSGENSKYNPLSTGLGLYVAKNIINLHHGKIYAKLNKDNIYTVGFYLPCRIFGKDIKSKGRL